MTIVERTCPRCTIKRTVQWGRWGAFCFNCRLHLDGTASSSTMAYRFQPAELVRLKLYRAAIAHGVYSDWP